MANPVKLQAEVTSVTSFGTGIYEVRLKPLGRVPRFKAGQFLHLTVDEYDPTGGFWPESRVFSIASNHTDPELCIVYSVKGTYTKKMESRLAVGKTVWLKLPYGEFSIDQTHHADSDVVLIAGGTGVSPYIPYLASLGADAVPGKRIRLYYGARLCSNVLFPELIDNCARSVPAFGATIQIENESADGLKLEKTRKKDGRLDIAEILKETEELRDRVFFLSGPPVMINSFKQKLLENNIQSTHIKIDEWE